MFFVLLLYALFASVFTIGKTGLQYTEPFFLVGTRMVLAGIIMLVYQYGFRREETKKVNLNWWKLAQLAAFNIYLTNAFEFWGLKYLTSFKTCFIYSLSPFVSALLSYFIFSERLSWKKWAGLAVGILGFIPILFLNETTTEQETGSFFFLSWAEVAVMIAAVCSVYGWILLKQLVKDGCPSFLANGYSMLIGGSFSLAHSMMVENWNPIPVTEFLPVAECTILLLVISNLICYNLYGALLKRYSATFMSFAGFSTPFFTAFFGWFYLGEVVTWPFYVSAAIVFLGLITFYQEELQRDFYGSKAIKATIN